MDIVSLLIGLASGAAGGNIAGKVMKSNMGTVGRSLTGIIGGTGLAAVTQMLGIGGVADPMAGGSLDVMSIVSSLVSGGVGGGILTAILGKVMKK